MSSTAELTLFAHLSDVESLDFISREGLPFETIPSPELRFITEWALNYYYESGRMRGPSYEAIKETWADELEQAEDLVWDGTEPDSIEWAVGALKSRHAYRSGQTFTKELGVKLADANEDEKVSVLANGADDLFKVAAGLQSKASLVGIRDGLRERAAAYMERAANTDTLLGMALDLPAIDTFTYGIHPGELAILAAGPKVGKSYALARVALAEWKRGRNTVLYTLENSTDMTLDRLICLNCGIDSNRFQRGQMTEGETAIFLAFLDQADTYTADFHIWKPDPGERTVSQLVRQAQNYDCESLIIDQLTFIEHPNEGRKARHEVIRDMLHELKSLISTGRNKIPCLLAHQINREGVKASIKAGELEMFHLAEGAEAERTADWVFSLFQSEEDRIIQRAKFQILAARRTDVADWSLEWDPAHGHVRVNQQLTPEAMGLPVA